MHKFIKFSFNSTIQGLKAYQFCLILLSILTMIDFILSTIKVKLPEPIQAFFNVIYNFQHMFYKPDLSIVPVDFTLAIFAVEVLILAGLLVYVINFIIEFEHIYDKVYQDGQQRYERSFNKKLDKTAKIIENKNKNFVLLYDICIEKNTQGFLHDEKTIDVDTKIIEYRLMFKNYILQNFQAKTKQTSNECLIFFDNIEQSNEIFDKIYEFESKTKELLKQMKLNFKLKTAVCIATFQDNIEIYLPKLQKLIRVAMPKKIMALGDFKTKYDTIKNKRYLINSLGEYSLGTEILDVYSLEPNPQ